MRTKIYYGAIALMWLLSSCVNSPNVSSSSVTGTRNGFGIKEYKIDEHSYIKLGYGMTHSGKCHKCKQELDSIVRNAVKESINTNKK